MDVLGFCAPVPNTPFAGRHIETANCSVPVTGVAVGFNEGTGVSAAAHLAGIGLYAADYEDCYYNDDDDPPLYFNCSGEGREFR